MDETHSIKGRGATISPSPRYLNTTTIAEDDGWNIDAFLAAEFPSDPPITQLFPDKTRKLITTNQSPDVPFDRSINPYKGCEHGCVYCFARPTHAFLDLSPGLDFETKIYYKTDPVERLHEALNDPQYACRPIAIGTNTDPYQPVEKELEVTRRILETLIEYQHPVSVVTKGVLILRDLDLLQELAALNLISVAISVTTLQNDLKRNLEPRTASPSARLRILSALSNANIPVGVMVAPIIPMLNDHELEDIVRLSAEAGAEFAGYVLIRLPLEVRPLFEDWLNEHYPLKAERVMNRIRDLHEGKTYDPRFGHRMRGTGVYADLIRKRFDVARSNCGLSVSENRSEVETEAGNLFVNAEGVKPLRTDLFRPRYQQTYLF